MKSISIAGILLIVLGALVFAYQGINYTRREKVLDVGPIHATKDTQEHIPISPVLGGLALIVGIALLVSGTRRSA
jgi:UDP-N-acetylmuramyl pentapeptide phosphotransferase/UDP-N-acetylglucosamine-1-phosphate transferase